jgi:mono/diheme cytochrome c family protein
MRTSLLVLAGMIGCTAAFAASEPTPEQLEFFEKKIRPIFVENCYKCHSIEQGKSKGDLTLDTRDGVLKGGETGPAIMPGDPAESLLVKAISYQDKDLQMPPKGKGDRLTSEQVADLTAWIKMGAPDPRKEPGGSKKLTGLTAKARAHWAYQQVKKPAIPLTKNRAWCITPVDAFILQKIEEKGMVPSPAADKMTLLRRATYDLIGLPPSPGEIENFLKDNSPQAFVKVVDRLLASPQYGERWGRFWLDTARYADTTGDRYNNNNMSDYRNTYAWTYRDYVIRAFNDDKPYDQFIIEQLAADKLPDIDKDKTRLAALGFITVGERFGNNNDTINDRIDVVSKGFLAMTVTCARCHDHMFDPIPTKDYYALHGVFSSIMEPKEEPVIIPAANKTLAADFEKQVAAIEAENRASYYKIVDQFNSDFRQKATAYIIAAHRGRGSNSAEDQLRAQALIKEHNLDTQVVRYMDGRIHGDDAVFGPFKRYLDGGDSWQQITKTIGANKNKRFNPIVAAAFASANPQTFDDIAAIYGKIFASVDDKGKAYVAAASQTLDKSAKITGFDPAELDLVQVPFRTTIAANLNTDQLRSEINGWPQQIRNRGAFNFARINELQLTHDGVDTRAMVVVDSPRPHDSAVFIRGQAENRGDVVPRRFLEVLSGGNPTPFKEGSGRLELARAIASKNNPLTARVMVNRVWMHHFGEGFVRTPDDLGTQAEKPSHPELLDYLSWYFMEQGWSLKKLHKLIMLSKVYQESSYTVPAHETIDPDNRLLWRANVRRLEFEAMRDTLLVLSGKLDKSMGGQPVNLTDEPYSYRRTVYGYIDRGNLPELMSHFDFSDPDMPNSKRTSTIVPQQALFLMNSPMSADVARAVIARRDVQMSDTILNKVMNIYRVVFQRDPKPAEIQLALAFVGHENKQEAQVAVAAKELSEKAAKQVADREKRDMEMMGRNDGVRAIRNEGKYVERKPLTPWETYVQALLLSNEAAYVN